MTEADQSKDAVHIVEETLELCMTEQTFNQMIEEIEKTKPGQLRGVLKDDEYDEIVGILDKTRPYPPGPR